MDIFFMENPMNKWMIWGGNVPLFLETPIYTYHWGILSPPKTKICFKRWSDGCFKPYEQRTKPITSAKGRGWNGHRFLCVPYRSWGFGVRGHEMSKWLKQIEAEAAERAAAEEKVAAAAMKMNRIVSYQEGNHFGLSVGMCL